MSKGMINKIYTLFFSSFSKGSKALNTRRNDPSSQAGNVVLSIAIMALTAYHKTAQSISNLQIHVKIYVSKEVQPILQAYLKLKDWKKGFHQYIHGVRMSVRMLTHTWCMYMYISLSKPKAQTQCALQCLAEQRQDMKTMQPRSQVSL